jgi:hypothetical protein
MRSRGSVAALEGDEELEAARRAADAAKPSFRSPQARNVSTVVPMTGRQKPYLL